MLNERLQTGCLRFSDIFAGDDHHDTKTKELNVETNYNRKHNYLQPILVVYTDDGIGKSAQSQPIKGALGNYIILIILSTHLLGSI